MRLVRSSAASDVYKRQMLHRALIHVGQTEFLQVEVVQKLMNVRMEPITATRMRPVPILPEDSRVRAMLAILVMV